MQIKRVYDAPAAADGLRVLIDRLWPRGLRRDRAALDLWLKDVAPSPALRQWFGHDPERMEAFAGRYRAELLTERTAALDQLDEARRSGPVTLLYAARDPKVNHAVVLRDVLEEWARRRRGKGAA